MVPINLEGMLSLGHPDSSIKVRDTPVFNSANKYDSNTFPKFIKGERILFQSNR